MLINELGRSIQADRQREIEQRLRQRGWLADAEDQARLAANEGRHGFDPIGSKGTRPIAVRSSGMPARSRPR